MSITLSEEKKGKIIIIKATGKLTQEDYAQFVPKVEQHIKTFHKIRMLFEMIDFHGWEAAALWQDLKFDVKHFRDIERLAMVGEKRWEKGMSVFCKPFTSAKIRYFDARESEKAYEWISEDSRTNGTETTNMATSSDCKPSEHKMHMCALKAEGFDKTNPARYRELTANPKFKCENCGATAAKGENLCKPIKL